MTTTSTIPAAIAYLYQQATAAYGAKAHVFDGPTPYTTQLSLPDRVWIGHNPLSFQAGVLESATSGDQQFATLGARTRNETYQIVCAVEHWSGDTTMATTRAAAFGLLASFELLLRGVPATGGPGDATLGGALPGGFAGIGGGVETYQDQDDKGCTCLVLFHIAAQARLTTG